jgi:hypothetical protein
MVLLVLSGINNMKYKMFVCVDGNKSLIASSYEFKGLEKLIEELENFGTLWEVTEDGVTVVTNFN